MYRYDVLRISLWPVSHTYRYLYDVYSSIYTSYICVCRLHYILYRYHLPEVPSVFLFTKERKTRAESVPASLCVSVCTTYIVRCTSLTRYTHVLCTMYVYVRCTHTTHTPRDHTTLDLPSLRLSRIFVCLSHLSSHLSPLSHKIYPRLRD